MFSIYDILQEADGDENQANAPAAADNAQGTDNNQQGDNAPAGNDNNDAQQDDFNMDMSLDDSDPGDDAGGEGGADDIDTDVDTADTGGGDAIEGEPVDANTDMFTSLSSEEQIIKITELKNQYNQLYNACDDLIEKISNIENTEDTVLPMSKLVNTLTDFKKYITDYFYTQFDNKSYYENDVKLNYLLSVFFSVKDVLEGIYKVNRQSDKNIE